MPFIPSRRSSPIPCGWLLASYPTLVSSAEPPLRLFTEFRAHPPSWLGAKSPVADGPWTVSATGGV